MGQRKLVVYVASQQERQQAEQTLTALGAAGIEVFQEAVEAEFDDNQIPHAMSNSGFLVDLPSGLVADETEFAADDSAAAASFSSNIMSEETLQLLSRFEQQAAHVQLPDLESSSLHQLVAAVDAISISQSQRDHREPLVDGISVHDTAPTAGKLRMPENQLLPEDAYLIDVSANLRPEWLEQLKGINVQGQRHAGGNLYEAFLTEEQVKQVEALPFVESIRRYGLTDTVTPSMAEFLQKCEECEVEAGDTEKFDVALHRSVDLEEVARFIDAVDGHEVLESSGMMLRFSAPVRSPMLAAISNLPQVRAISPYRPPDFLVNVARELIGVDAVNPAGADHWTGAGEVIAIVDSGVDTGHPDLAGVDARGYRSGSAADANGHGTHVAGIIAGSGAASGGVVRGVAPGARLISLGIVNAAGERDLPVDYGDVLGAARDAGASIINLSWGKQYKGEYQIGAESVDRFVRENPEVLVVVAAGNAGEAPAGGHSLSTVYMPGSAKNVVTVAASASSRTGESFERKWSQVRGSRFPSPPAGDEVVSGNASFVAAISSRGPTDFDMVKPDVAAPGTFILAPKASQFRLPPAAEFEDFEGQYVFLHGTSMAAPQVAGAAGIIRQYLREKLNITRPSAALLKCLVIASARRLEPSPGFRELASVGYPDFEQGYGRLDLGEILPPDTDGAALVHVVDVPNGSPDALAARQRPGGPRSAIHTYEFNVAAATQRPLRIVLSWIDSPGRFVQNDLQLIIAPPGGGRVTGNSEHRAFRPRFLPEDAPLLDKTNTTESVDFSEPGPGRYLVTVLAKDTPQPPQGYALCVRGDIDQLERP